MVSSTEETPRGRAYGNGNQGGGREPLKIASGEVLVIDQFMLGNKQFLNRVRGQSMSSEEGRAAIVEAVQMYGGCLVTLPPGEYEVARDPEQTVMVLRPAGEGDENDDPTALLDSKGNVAPIHRVFVDTRCLVFVDAGLLSDEQSLSQYQQLRERGDEKQARDFIRELGGAVRYGFNRYGDELGVFSFPEERAVALWPDVVE